MTQPTSSATSAIGTTTPHPPIRRSNGVTASRTTCTTRNHSGVTTRNATVSTVCCGSPRADMPNSTTAHAPSSAQTGHPSRRTFAGHGVVDRAAPKPPT
nr:hypothetical protein [Saccharothrix espanaensis]